MQESGIRNRGAEGQASRVPTQEDDGTTSGTAQVTSAEIVPDEQTQDTHPPLSPTAKAFQSLRAFAARFSNETQGSEEQVEENIGEEEKVKEFIFDDVHHHPQGYPQLACFMNSNNDWTIFRRFSYLSTRVLNHLEVELTDIEKELDAIDRNDAADPIRKRRLRGFESTKWDNAHLEVLARCRTKLCEYNELFVGHSQVRALGLAPPSHHGGLYNWMMSRKPLCEGKDDFILHPDDFVSVAGNSQRETPLADFIKTLFRRWPKSRLSGLLQTDRELSKSKDPYVDHISEDRIRVLVKAITVAIATGMLLIPVMLLFLVQTSRESMAWLVFGFVMAFAVILSVVTQAKVQEVLIGTAAYAAVLVTFAGNLQNS